MGAEFYLRIASAHIAPAGHGRYAACIAGRGLEFWGTSIVNVWEKLITDPEYGPRAHSPLAHAALGLCCLYFALYTCITDSIRLSKAGNGVYIHFADHPVVFVASVVGALLGAAWGLSSARKRYRMHRD